MDDAKMPKPLGYNRGLAQELARQYQATRSRAPPPTPIVETDREAGTVEAGGESVQPELWLDALSEDEVEALISLLPKKSKEKLMAEDIGFVVPPLARW
eukprot:tig00020902_g15030.t1